MRPPSARSRRTASRTAGGSPLRGSPLGAAEFWVQEDPDAAHERRDFEPIRLILSVDDPDAAYDRAVAAGATVVAPVSEDHGWRTGRIVDPFGHAWEISTQLDVA